MLTIKDIVLIAYKYFRYRFAFGLKGSQDSALEQTSKLQVPILIYNINMKS